MKKVSTSKPKKAKAKIKKLSKKKAVVKKVIKAKVKAEKPIGKVTHYYGELKVAVVKFKKDIRTGSALRFKGATTDFKKTVTSMQINHEACRVAKKGKQVGIKVGKKVRVGDLIYAAG